MSGPFNTTLGTTPVTIVAAGVDASGATAITSVDTVVSTPVAVRECCYLQT